MSFAWTSAYILSSSSSSDSFELYLSSVNQDHSVISYHPMHEICVSGCTAGFSSGLCDGWMWRKKLCILVEEISSTYHWLLVWPMQWWYSLKLLFVMVFYEFKGGVSAFNHNTIVFGISQFVYLIHKSLNHLHDLSHKEDFIGAEVRHFDVQARSKQLQAMWGSFETRDVQNYLI